MHYDFNKWSNVHSSAGCKITFATFSGVVGGFFEASTMDQGFENAPTHFQEQYTFSCIVDNIKIPLNVVYWHHTKQVAE
jgi:hypothetical protein